MKILKFLCLFLMVSLVVGVTGCKDDDHDNDPNNMVTITIEAPMNDGMIPIADCGSVHIHVDVEASVENHEMEILLHPEGDVNDKIIDFDMHAHDKVITFAQDVDLCSYGAGACFHLEVVACVDHDCGEKSTADVKFCLQ